jgi:hypothetical protein
MYGKTFVSERPSPHRRPPQPLQPLRQILAARLGVDHDGVQVAAAKRPPLPLKLD